MRAGTDRRVLKAGETTPESGAGHHVFAGQRCSHVGGGGVEYKSWPQATTAVPMVISSVGRGAFKPDTAE